MELIKKWLKDKKYEGSKMFLFMSKLKALKNKLLKWNREHFKNIFKEKHKVEQDLNYLNEEVIKKGMESKIYHKEYKLLATYKDILAKEEIFWKQKSRKT